MAITDGTTSTQASCLKCGATGPNNFRLEQRGTFKRPTPGHLEVVAQVGEPISVWACIKCGSIIKEV